MARRRPKNKAPKKSRFRNMELCPDDINVPRYYGINQTTGVRPPIKLLRQIRPFVKPPLLNVRKGLINKLLAPIAEKEVAANNYRRNLNELLRNMDTMIHYYTRYQEKIQGNKDLLIARKLVQNPFV